MSDGVLYTIYVLVDPRNDDPFYVGATKRPISKRLWQHVNNSQVGSAAYSVSKAKMERIKSIISAGYYPEIKQLEVVEYDLVDEAEARYYNHYSSLGHILLQSKSQLNMTNRRNSSFQTTQVSASVQLNIIDHIGYLAELEKRSFSRMVAILLEEAVKQRILPPQLAPKA